MNVGRTIPPRSAPLRATLRNDVTTIKAAPRILKALSSEGDVISPLEVKEADERHG